MLFLVLWDSLLQRTLFRFHFHYLLAISTSVLLAEFQLSCSKWCSGKLKGLMDSFWLSVCWWWWWYDSTCVTANESIGFTRKRTRVLWETLCNDNLYVGFGLHFIAGNFRSDFFVIIILDCSCRFHYLDGWQRKVSDFWSSFCTYYFRCDMKKRVLYIHLPTTSDNLSLT